MANLAVQAVIPSSGACLLTERYRFLKLSQLALLNDELPRKSLHFSLEESI